MSIRVLTHRGLEPLNERFPWHESSREAFADQLRRGFGLEFDPAVTADGKLIVLHDRTVSRLTRGRSDRNVAEMEWSELRRTVDGAFNGTLITVGELFELIRNRRNERGSAPDTLHALHLKGYLQSPAVLPLLVSLLQEHTDLLPVLVLFDLRPETAEVLRDRVPGLRTAASVSHPYDVTRFNSVVGGTLMTPDDLLGYGDLYSWAWLDEWDLSGSGGTEKKLYTEETVGLLRARGYSVAFVSPELHATSPALYGGESHPDGSDLRRVEARAVELIRCAPEIICTDYPEQYRHWCMEQTKG